MGYNREESCAKEAQKIIEFIKTLDDILVDENGVVDKDTIVNEISLLIELIFVWRATTSEIVYELLELVNENETSVRIGVLKIIMKYFDFENEYKKKYKLSNFE